MNSHHSSYLIILLATILSLVWSSCQDATQEPKITQPLTVPPIFSNHMVLQQAEVVPIWGTATPGLMVNVQSGWGNTIGNISDEQGNWKIELPTPKAPGPYTLLITAATDSILIEDVLIGEVWLASGQSNMEMPLAGYPPVELVDNAEEEIANAKYPSIRFFDVQRAMGTTPVEDYVGRWKVTSPQTASEFSATAYFFARELHQQINEPIGIIGSNWGGTPVEAWMSREKIAKLRAFRRVLAVLASDKVATYTDWFTQFPTIKVPTESVAWETLDLKDSQWKQADTDDSNWEEVTVPITFEKWKNITDDGVYWFRKKIDLPTVNSDYTFEVEGGIDNMDLTYINGKKIGFTHCWHCPRKYNIPKEYLRVGENMIAIRAIDTGDAGRIKGNIFLKDTSGKKISLSGTWKGKHTAGLQNGKFLLYDENPTAFNNPPSGIENFRVHATVPTVLFNGMINPLIPYNIKGVIWYQGEGNVGRANQYLKLFPDLIEDWRTRWGNEFPFYFVQIAPFNYGKNASPLLRDAQRKSLKTPKTGMVVTLDIGHPTKIHPGNKQTVGYRLAQLALKNDYGKAIIASGPSLKRHQIKGNKIILEFDNIGSGLVLKKGIPAFEIAGSDRRFFPAVAKLIGQTLEVTSSKVVRPVRVRYAWKDTSVGVLFNEEGFPSSSFITE